MHTYEQSTGRWFHNGELLGTGYSGNGEGKNNPNKDAVHNIGPIPRGLYTIERPIHTSLAPVGGWPHGPFVLPLTPDPENEMFGREGFLVHGDKINAPGTASEGCIIQSRPVREAIWATGDRDLEVVDFFVPARTRFAGS